MIVKRQTIIFCIVALLTGGVFASGDSAALLHAGVDLSDQTALQRGAKIFMNYCSGCHSLKYLRYSQIAKGLGLTTFDGDVDLELLRNNLVFTEAFVGDPIQIAMPAVDSREWFGAVPPDLSLVARVRGADWLYSYLKGFYRDKSKPFGSNNQIFPDVAMPNILAPLQGEQIPVYETKNFDVGGQDQEVKEIKYLQLLHRGSMTQHQFDATVLDLVTFLVYVGEPVKLTRVHLGIWVIGFLLLLLGFMYPLKKLYWKDIKH